jgi:hypothetical protein
MPTAQHPQAKFDPISPDLDLHALVERTPNFHWVLRISAAQIRNIGPQEFEKLVFLHVVHGGKPLVIEKWNDRLPKSLFSAEWLEATHNKKRELCFAWFLCHLAQLTMGQPRMSATSVGRRTSQ